MKDKNLTSRRAFFTSGGATLGAGVAAAAGAGAFVPAEAAASSADAEAIRRLHMAFVAAVEAQRAAGAMPSHRAYRANARQISDAIQISQGGCSASATWHVDVKVGTALEGDSTAAQMARLQGMLGEVHWESGALHARYQRANGQWRMSEMRFESAGAGP